ncbi:Toprim domain-containing protein [Halorubrum aquaticum]|uniref:DNA primase DnaG n=1 Tax=Halorubrum aquaticum TaxID=387340 RepID=A0A1I3C1L6_9EURY|nr:DNA primase DnaG [Halorubrum aquaticum]SFH68099.1 Toprim domain-containing protein [Halorubrum aquaticum]
MNDTAKYLIRATIAADGVVERSDVVGAVFGQTEGLLGDELDLRDLQESSKVGRIDVEIRSENGQSFGEVTVASSLDKVETAILAASLETIDRIGPCGAAVEVTSIEDVRAAKRREVVERAKELVASGFEETSLASDDVLEEVRDAARIEGVVDYEGLPAGPRVGDSDAVIVVEGRADVSTLLECGIKNAVAVEGTNVPDAVADLTRSRTVTAFLDGDRGGELILRELAQVGEVDYVAFAPPGESVEDLDRGAVFEALRGKVPYETLADAPNLREAAGSGPETDADDGEDDAGGNADTDDAADIDDDADIDTDDAADATAADALRPDSSAATTEPNGVEGARDPDEFGGSDASEGSDDPDGSDDPEDAPGTPSDRDDDATTTAAATGDATTADADDAAPTDRSVGTDDADSASDPTSDDEPRSLEEHVQEVVDRESGLARLLDDDLGVLDEVEVDDAFDAVEGASDPPHAVVVDGRIDQRLLDVAAQRGVSRLFGRELGEFVKRPIGTRVSTVGDLPIEA